MNVMILAAGEGTRFRPQTLIKPKPALPFLNVPLAFYSLALLENTPVEKLVVNTFHLPKEIVHLFQNGFLPTKNLDFSHEIGEIQGSGGGLKAAQKFFRSPHEIIMLNGDEVILPHQANLVARALTQHQNRQALATLLVTEHPEVGNKFGGVWLNEKNEILDIGKTKPESAQQGLHFVGVFIFAPRIFDYLPRGPSHIFTDVLLPALRLGERVDVYKSDLTWFETGNLADYLKATEACLEFLTKPSAESAYLKKVLSKFSPQSKLNGRILSASPLPQDFSTHGFAVIGSQAKILDNTTLTNCVVDSKVSLEAGFVAENKLLLNGSR
jgi:mannose-1-phosphate guanylyltransferase